MIIADLKGFDEEICSWHVYDKNKCFFYTKEKDLMKKHSDKEIFECHLEWNNFTDKWIMIIYVK